MDRKDLTSMLWFVAVAEEASFTRAAARLGTSQSTLSHTVKQLEARLGLRLLNRTTRSVMPTEAGERLLQTLAPRLREIEADVDSLMAFRDKPSGSVRLTLSDHALNWIVWPKLKPVLREYPDIHVEFSIDSGFRNIVEERFDAGVRLGESVDKDMIAVRIGPDWRLVAVASPDYLATRAVPVSPQDLVHHHCINHRQTSSGGLYAWEFERDGREIRVRVEGQLTFNSALAMVDAALSGLGIAYVPENLVADLVAAGKLVQVLDDWSPMFPGYYLYYPTRRQNSPAFAIVIDALRK
ncbi:MAG TPA: LysR family transcriptional regulator [Paracoccus sp. (in: a-proteobacteria)]|uniref:LysR family transcriptional regulator n=1 Tax=Paracoccus sp. TaxID=267 RepID=UPI002C55C50C|nr:LysR family transcriptional regulator [Paracoccus sp. (in: a-proteobacteria)]HWL57013.1 LysR family transcriptional regulator [Paracoccus sp. (in: a-proteobacteria)]